MAGAPAARPAPPCDPPPPRPRPHSAGRAAPPLYRRPRCRCRGPRCRARRAESAGSRAAPAPPPRSAPGGAPGSRARSRRARACNPRLPGSPGARRALPASRPARGARSAARRPRASAAAASRPEPRSRSHSPLRPMKLPGGQVRAASRLLPSAQERRADEALIRRRRRDDHLDLVGDLGGERLLDEQRMTADQRALAFNLLRSGLPNRLQSESFGLRRPLSSICLAAGFYAARLCVASSAPDGGDALGLGLEPALLDLALLERQHVLHRFVLPARRDQLLERRSLRRLLAAHPRGFRLELGLLHPLLLELERVAHLLGGELLGEPRLPAAAVGGRPAGLAHPHVGARGAAGGPLGAHLGPDRLAGPRAVGRGARA